MLTAIYFGADHFVWAYQIGLITNKTTGERWQKVSLWSWALGSVCTVVAESLGIAASMSVPRKEGESEEEYAKRADEARKGVNAKVLALVHGVIQVCGPAAQAPVAPCPSSVHPCAGVPPACWSALLPT